MKVTEEHVVVALDRFHSMLGGEVVEGEVFEFHRAVEDMTPEAVELAVDTWLLDPEKRWRPTPGQFLQAVQAAARELAIKSQRATASTGCGFCKGYLWGFVSSVQRDGVEYGMVEPCERCAPLLHGAVQDLQSQRRVSERRSVSAETRLDFRLGDALGRARENLAAGGAQFDSDLLERRRLAHSRR